ncbi:hypothetical protein I6N96_06440 [Enterococcus sp. BWM-S5]|uniref:DUF5067 domain-containing protein n=1 Tax=Enterococcus larvae TaxID=2794352 RepID=A0ABS4CH17_9ENTE|nr:hypothetical protein [Enterococcus larvae]MBP1045914.1 hypothetical protein [Enterococcus larvae]
MEKKPNTNKTSKNVTSSLSKQQQLIVRLGIAVVVVVLALILIIPRAQANIRSSQIDSLVDVEFSSKKVKFADTKTIDKEIEESKATTVLFTVPSGKTYEQLISLFKDEKAMQDYSRSITIYPIVYDAADLEKKYNVKKETITVIFFESGKEKNRFTVDESMDVKTAFIPKLNELPLAAVDPATQEQQNQAQEQASGETQDAAPQETTETVQNEEQIHQEKLQTIQ